MRFLKACKDIVLKICGKARWLLLATALLICVDIINVFSYSWYPYIYGVSYANGFPVKECPFDNAMCFSITDGGDMALLGTDTQFKAYARMNLDTGVQDYCGIGMTVDEDPGSIGLFIPMYFALADDGQLYAIHYDQLNNTSLLTERASVICLSKDMKKVDELFGVDLGIEGRQQGTAVSGLHYYDGKITFALRDLSGVKLYSIDNNTHVVSESDIYPTDPDGTYTADVIPVDGAFLFMRSDGNVYRVEFGQPMGESIFNYAVPLGEESPYFETAAVADGKLYVTTVNDPYTVYLLEDGKLTKEYALGDIAGDAGAIRGFDSYRPDGASSDTLVLCYENALITCTEKGPALQDITMRPEFTALMNINSVVENLFLIPLAGLIINLIIRRKTLLYKQLIITIPVFTVLAVALAVSVYSLADMEKLEDVEKDITSICCLSAKTFDGYDFTGLTTPGRDTGAQYKKLRDKIETLSQYSEDYLFSVIYRGSDGTEYLLASDDWLDMPMQDQKPMGEMFPASGSNDSSEVFIDKDLSAIVGYSSSVISRITAYGKLHDAASDGNFYIKVEVDYGNLFSERSGIYYQIAGYSIVIICVIMFLIILSTLLMMRVIRKATATVKSISEGNLSARVNYRSKDELGQICSQVDEMAESLQKSFDEKDRTEKFYYKFVPERFREYLGKENFTDLELGDASNRELTVLFCDIRSFSINSEMMTAKENFAFVNTIYGKAGPIIREHNGFIDKYIGDAVMALFEDADDAVACGVDLYRAIVRDPGTARELGVSDINIGIGIHSGMAMIGIVGESERLSGTVISDTVNLSSRLESLTKQYQTAILVSKDTVDRMSSPEDLSLRYLGMIQVAGVNEVKGVYEVLDCLEDSVRNARSDNASDFREALRLFQLGRREDALRSLEKLSSEGRGDHVTDMYMDYIRTLSSDDKGNVFRFVRK